MKTILAIIFTLIISFLLTAFSFWLLTLLLGVFGIVITFTWVKAFAIWMIIIILKSLFR